MAEPADPLLAFPYPLRRHQAELVSTLHSAVLSGRHAVIESGTGTGKTVCALTAALVGGDARVLYLTRTNSQARQVLVEYRNLRGRVPLGPAVALQGRQHLCPLRGMDAELEAADAEELGVMCGDRMRAAEAVAHGRAPRVAACPFHLRGLQEGGAALLAWAREEAPDAESLVARVSAAGQCPFVLTRKLLPETRLVVAPYVYFLHPHLRAALLRSMGASLRDLVVIVDEAHNLPPSARDLATHELGARTLAMAAAEARRFGDPTILRDIPLSVFLDGLRDVLHLVRETYLPAGAEDALFPPEELDVLLLTQFRTSTPQLDRALALMDEYAANVKEARRREGKRPRSDVGVVARFLLAYRRLDPSEHAPLVEGAGPSDARLVLQALDPAALTGALDEAAATLHLSGTLQPLDEYRDAIGLPPDRTSLARFPSPFPQKNRLVLVDATVTTRHEEADPAMWARIGERLREVRAATDRNMAVFLPSYEALHRLAPFVRARPSFVEARGASQARLMSELAAFKATRGATLLSVVGGRLSEGLDFPDDQLEVVVIVGLPYAPPSAKQEALVRFCDRKFGKGWDWAVRVPMTRRVLQAAGRLIRSPTDRGVVILMDRRAASLRDVLPEISPTQEVARETAAFFAPP